MKENADLLGFSNCQHRELQRVHHALKDERAGEILIFGIRAERLPREIPQ